jgi:steroid 5-alpha reductase family enzyme
MASIMLNLFLTCSLIIFIYASGWFLISVIKKRNDVADIAWGLGYVLLCIYLFITQTIHFHALLVYLMVIIWGMRLSIHIFNRNKNKSEDFRYKKWREEWGKNFYLRSYLQVYLLQGFFLLLIASPVIFVAASTAFSVNIFTYISVAIWVLGFIFQSVGDYQLAVFKANRKASEIMQTGLWKYSRHPNYFGEILMWWAIFIMIIPMEYSIFFIVSPLAINLLLVYVSGVPMLEKKYEGNLLYEAYKKKTPALIPKFW